MTESSRGATSTRMQCITVVKRCSQPLDAGCLRTLTACKHRSSRFIQRVSCATCQPASSTHVRRRLFEGLSAPCGLTLRRSERARVRLSIPVLVSHW
jgi:hypothetical protein